MAEKPEIKDAKLKPEAHELLKDFLKKENIRLSITKPTFRQINDSKLTLLEVEEQTIIVSYGPKQTA